MLTMETDEFLAAIKSNDLNRINQLLQANPNLSNATEKNGVSVIFLALYRGNKAAALAIATKKTELDVFEASALDDLERLKIVVYREPSSISSYSRNGFTPLRLAWYLAQKESV